MSAACAALGISLGLMVGKMTLAKQKGRQKSQLSSKLLALDKLRLKALDIVDCDPVVFEELMCAYGSRKSRKAKSAKQLDCLLNQCCDVQIKLISVSQGARAIISSFKSLVRGSLVDDLKISDIVLSAAIRAALITANLNVIVIKDSTLRKKLTVQLNRLV